MTGLFKHAARTGRLHREAGLRPLAAILAGAALSGLALGGCAAMSGLETRARVASNPSCTDFFFQIYFAKDSAELSKPAAQVVAHAGRHINGCAVAQVEVLGLADATGTPEANLDLSHQRARTVAQALIRAGLPTPVFHLNAIGDAGAVKDGVSTPVRRRAFVYIRFQH